MCKCPNHKTTPSFQTHLPHGTTRRDVLKLATATAGIAALGPLGGVLPIATGAPRSQKRAIVINLFGGCDTLNVIVPHTLSRYYDRRPTIAISAGSGGLPLDTVDAVNPNSDYLLHPSCDNMQRIWNDGDMAFVNRVGYPSPNLSHFTSQSIYSTGVRNEAGPTSGRSGWIARFADRNAPTALGCAALEVGRPVDFIGGTSNPLLVGRLSNFKFSGNGGGGSLNTNDIHRLDAAKGILERFSGSANSNSAKDALEQAHDLADQIQTAVASYSSPVAYQNTAISRRVQDAARMIQAGFETQMFFTGTGGYDVHGSETSRQASLMTQLDDAVGAFEQDCKTMGVWDDMVIIIMTEFGRRNFENGANGTDHGHAYTEILLGGAVNSGRYGPDLINTDIDTNWLTHAVDFRSVYKDVLVNHLGANGIDEIFPEAIPGDFTLGIV